MDQLSIKNTYEETGVDDGFRATEECRSAKGVQEIYGPGEPYTFTGNIQDDV